VLAISSTILVVEVIGAFVSGSLAPAGPTDSPWPARIRRLVEPPEVASGAMVVFGVAGLLGNALSILILTRVSGENLNTRAALLEVIKVDGRCAALAQ
jgi:hypothetical protein